MTWKIVADSSCELRHLEGLGPDLSFDTVPLKIRVGEREFVDNAALDTAVMMSAMGNYNGPATTACPSPEEWAEKYLQADQVIALTITSGLSGTYNSALVAKEMVLESHPEKKIYVLDTLSTGGQMVLDIWKARELIEAGLPFEQVCAELEIYNQQRGLLFALANFDNLVKNGRMSRLVGFMAGAMNMRAVGRASDAGKIELLHKTRGETRMLAYILESIDRSGYDGSGPVVISHCFNETAAHLLANGIHNKWPGARVEILPTGGLTSFYAENQGLIVGY